MPRREATSYRASWVDPVTGKRTWRRCRTKAQRDALQRKMRDIAWDVKHGLRPKLAVAEAENSLRPIAAMLDAYRDYLVAAGRSAPYVKNTHQLLVRLANDLGWLIPGDVEPLALRKHLAGLEVSERSRVAYGKAWRSLTAWGASPAGRWYAADPLVGLDVSRKGVDPAARRRALTVAEYDRLVATSDRGDDFTLLAHTGLRWTEAAALTVGDVRMSDRVLVVPKGVGKTDSHRESFIPLPELVIDMLRARRQVGATPLLQHARPMSRQWAAEIKAAKIEKETAAGVVVPASMRATYTTWLTAAGCPADDRHRLRRDAMDIAEERYTSAEQIIERLRPHVTSMVKWCDRERMKVIVSAG